MAETDVLQAKAFLLQASEASGLNLYDHLADILAKVLDERPKSAADILEDISRKVKASRFSQASTLQEVPEVQRDLTQAKTQEKLFKSSPSEEEEEGQHVLPNVMEIAQFFEDNSIGLGREETFRIFLSLKQLAETQPILKSIRFWGKVFGLENSYIVAEAEYKEGEEPRPTEQEQNDTLETSQVEAAEETPDAVPKSQYKAPPPVASEDYGHGTNKKVYFVCSEAGAEWRLLPNITPAQISVARQIKKFLTGRLDAPVVSYPPFPGNEANYLRAQIARITAGTQVSPLGFYNFDEEGDEEDEDARENFVPNEEYEEKPRNELLDPSLAGWVHKAPFILPQGRCRWVNPQPPKESDGDEDEEEEEGDPAAPEPETGPPLLQPLQNDEEVDGQPAWSTRLSSTLLPGYASVSISSNRWPGAHAYAIGKKFENVYIGWGHKYSADPYSPPLPPPAENECTIGPETTEALDPSREEEAAFEAAQAQALEEANAAEQEQEED